MSDQDDTARRLMEVGDNMLPFIEWAEGQKQMMEGRGWSAKAAEEYATELLVSMTRTMFAQLPKR